jgi:hypothetical protein
MRRRAVAARMAGGRLDLLIRETFFREASRDRARKRNFDGLIGARQRQQAGYPSNCFEGLMAAVEKIPTRPELESSAATAGMRKSGGARTRPRLERSRSGARAMGCRSSVAVGLALRAVFAIRPEPAPIPSIDREGDRTPCRDPPLPPNE